MGETPEGTYTKKTRAGAKCLIDTRGDSKSCTIRDIFSHLTSKAERLREGRVWEK